ncbi:MAG: metal ABC transporter permease [Actinomycetota bacterium]|nr:metal ABC transporter permease [Actinomycetota bacterium]MDQ3432719.1 metal ABC transporter permease [Actinomycetota bacterium]
MSTLAYDFMQRALVAALLTGLAAPAIGTYLVQKRLALLGDGIGHVALTGVALGLLTGQAPLLTAVVVAVAGATLIEVLRLRGKASGDVALALFFYGGIAAGVLLTGLAGGSAATLTSYLFGALTTVSDAELALVAGLAVLVLAVSLGLAPQLFAVCQDEEHARVSGLRVGAYSVLISVLAAVTVTLAMRTVGLLLVSALMVVPVATAQQLTRAFRATLGLAMALGVVASVSGVWTSFYADTAPGPTIVLLALAGFALASPVGGMLRRRRRVHAPFEEEAPADAAGPVHALAEDHPHQHGEGCGHLAVEHGDHVDYVHDGHRHVPHDDHYDEH